MGDYWEENNIKKPQQVVVCAACRVYGITLCGARHWDSVMRQQYDNLSPPINYEKNEEQGFIDQFGTFLTREEAMQIAKKAGQKIDIERGCGGDKTRLYSEGLY